MMISKRYLLAALLLCCFALPAFSQSTSANAQPCILGYTVGFFNGVANTELDGMATLNQIQQSIHEATGKTDDTYNNEDVSYQLYYNHTGSTVGASALQDIAETFMQRENEADPSGYFSTNHLYMMWEEINGGGSTSYLSYTMNPAPFGDFLTTVTSQVVIKQVAALSSLLSNPPTTTDYATQNAQLDVVANSGRKMMLIAHSQGNLFVNHAYDYIQPEVGSTRVKVVHVAPASPTLRGQYLLSDNDAIINGLRAVGGLSTVVANNISIKASLAEPTGHSMGPTYLDTTAGRTNGREQVEALETGALQALTAPSGCSATLTPSTPTLAPGATQTFTAALNPAPVDPVLLTSYVWSVSGTAGGTFAGGSTSVTTSAPSIAYTVPASPPAGSADSVSVKVIASKTAGDQVNAVTLGTGAAQVTILNIKVVVSPNGSGINTGQTQALTATLAGSPNPALSFRWSTPGTYGSLTDPMTGKTGRTNYCTTANTATYVSSSASGIPAGTSKEETVTVQAYSDNACGTALGIGSAAIFITGVKDLNQWVGTYNCVAAYDGSTYNLSLYERPFLSGSNYGSVPSGTDLMYLQTNPRNTVQSYGYIAVDSTVPTRAYDSRYTSYNDAYNGRSSIYTLSAGMLQWNFGSTPYLTCSR